VNLVDKMPPELKSHYSLTITLSKNFMLIYSQIARYRNWRDYTIGTLHYNWPICMHRRPSARRVYQ